MDQQTQNLQETLEELFNELVATGKFTGEQKQELFAQLEKTLVLATVNRLINQLSEKDRLELEKGNWERSQDLFNFFSKRIPQEKLQKVMAESVEEVMKEFLGEL
jgi:predicted transcriptional regulator